MPDDADPDSAHKRFATSAGRYGVTLVVRTVGRGLIAGTVKVRDVVTEREVDDIGTDEITLESESVRTPRDVASWLINEALPEVIKSRKLSALITERIGSIRTAFGRIETQLLNRAEPSTKTRAE